MRPRALGTRRHVLGTSTRFRFNALGIYTVTSNHSMHIFPRVSFTGGSILEPFRYESATDCTLLTAF
jgi:hypothetical protein